MYIVNKYANIYLQKLYIKMSCLCDFLKVTITNRRALTMKCLTVITHVRDAHVHLAVLSKKEMIFGMGERCI